MTGTSLRLGIRPFREVDGDVDLPALDDPVAGLERSATILAIVSLGIVALTAANRVGAGYNLSDVGALLTLYAIATVVLSRVPWARLAPTWSTVILGVQILFVVSLTTITGGGRSPYFALYAPILALAGWHFRRDWLVVTVGAIVAVEWWRAMVIEAGRGSADQLTIALPLFAAIGALAHLTAQRLVGAVVAIRRDQVRTADTLTEVRRLALTPDVDDPLEVASGAATRIFGSTSRAVVIDPPAPQGSDLLARSDGGRRLSIAVAGPSGTHGVLELERDTPFSTTEGRLAAMLGDTAGQAIEARGPGKRAAN